MKNLILYDNSGVVYFTMTIDNIPDGLEKFIFEVPEGKQVQSVDLSDPTSPKLVFLKQSNVMDVSREISNLQSAIADLYEMINV